MSNQINNSVILELKNITKKYSGKEKPANDNITLNLRSSEILCIAGENGAGKTTLMKVLCGLEKPDTGEIFINGKKEEINSPVSAIKNKIGMAQQHFMLFPDFTVAQNIVMGSEPKKYGIFFDFKKAEKYSQEIIDKNNFSVSPGKRIKDLSLGEIQQVEICRLLYRDAQIMVMDEPTSILTESEIEALFKTLKSLTRSGKSVILITHKLREIKKIADRVAVMRKGNIIAVKENGDIDEKEIAFLMAVNENYENNTNIKKGITGGKETIITFENVTVKKKEQKMPLLEDVSFQAKSGEILGFAGVGGNGLGVLEAVFGGFLHPCKGKIFHGDRDITHYNIRKLRNQGLSFVPEDRVNVASAKNATIAENLLINRRHEFMRYNYINKKKIYSFTKNLIESYNIENAYENSRCSVLSGGNLQKLILAREIDLLRDYIVLSNPAWGLDIVSTRYLYNEIVKLRNKGAAVILISKNLDEILELSDRIIVMYRGKISGVFVNGEDKTREKIISCMQLGSSSEK